jgi:hypothetical protein
MALRKLLKRARVPACRRWQTGSKIGSDALPGGAPRLGDRGPRWRSRASQLKSHQTTRPALGHASGTNTVHSHKTAGRPRPSRRPRVLQTHAHRSTLLVGGGTASCSARPSSDPCAREAHGPKLNPGRLNGASAREPLRSTGAAFLKMPKKQLDTAVVAQGPPARRRRPLGPTDRQGPRHPALDRRGWPGLAKDRGSRDASSLATAMRKRRRGKDYRRTPMMAIG